MPGPLKPHIVCSATSGAGSECTGIAFGNSGVHVPRGMAYSVAGLVRDFRPEGYPQEEPMVPQGMSVIVNAPSVFRFTSCACPGGRGRKRGRLPHARCRLV